VLVQKSDLVILVVLDLVVVLVVGLVIIADILVRFNGFAVQRPDCEAPYNPLAVVSHIRYAILQRPINPSLISTACWIALGFAGCLDL
jgi:hypothetical protein